MNFLIRGTTADAAKHHPFNTHRVCCTKDRTYVMLTPYVIQNHYEGQFVSLAVLVDVHATHFSGRPFCIHSEKGK